MVEVNKVLFALELTSISTKVAPWVGLTVTKFEAEVHVLHVVPRLEFWGVAYASTALLESDYDNLTIRAEDMVQTFCLNHFGNEFQPTVAIRVGSPADEIVSYVVDENMDMVVMGTHGQRGLDRALYGSVADRVLRSCPVPVMCINPLKYEPPAAAQNW